MKKINDMEAWKLFCEVVRSGGIVSACTVLQCEPSKVSRAIKALEEELKVSLFTRTSKPATLTDAGLIAYERACKLLIEHENMLAEIREDNCRMAGLISLSTSPGMNASTATPMAIEFKMRYPDISFEINEWAGSVPEAFRKENGTFSDIVIGYGPDRQIPGIVSLYIGEMPFIACASPLYIKKQGLIRDPDECIKHTGIITINPTRPVTSSLKHLGIIKKLKWASTVSLKHPLAVKTALLLGAGISPDYPLIHCASELQNKSLINVMPGWQRDSISCYVFVREASWAKKRVRVFAQWYAQKSKDEIQSLEKIFPQFFIGHHPKIEVPV